MLDKNVYIDAANDYRALDALSDELARIDPSQTEYFIKCIFRLLKLHRAFYQKATLILLDIEDGEQQAYISLFKRDAREEQKRLIGILRSFETQETLIERLTRRSKAANMA
jgi:hypothetical protein